MARELRPRLNNFAGLTINKLLKPLGLEAYPSRYHLLDRQMTHRRLAHFLYFNRLFGLIEELEGDVVECGVGRGVTLSWLAMLMREEETERSGALIPLRVCQRRQRKTGALGM